MYLLDTNVVSELRKSASGNANQQVIDWASGVPSEALFLSTVSVLEIEVGILLVERRDERQGRVLRSWLESKVLPAFEGRVLPFALNTARECAKLHVPDPKPDRDSMIAATALASDLVLVTRNERDFGGIDDLRLLNPWVSHSR